MVIITKKYLCLTYITNTFHSPAIHIPIMFKLKTLFNTFEPPKIIDLLKGYDDVVN